MSRVGGAWLRESKGRWREVVALFRQAGEGLAAAHAAGLVHRDFKPDNVLVGADGRVRVTDFGLARSDGPLLAARAQVPGSNSGASVLDASLTATGALVGTPAYMAPERLVPQGRADALSDQFSFCVALFEALYGERPFPARDLASLAAAVREGRVRATPRGRAPRWLVRIVLRGLAADPAARWPSMRALLDELARGQRVTPARVLFPLLTLCAAGLLVWNSRPVCTGAEAAWGGLWSAGEKEAVHRAFQATKALSAEPSFASIDAALDQFRAGWIELHRDACLATHARHEQSETLLDLRMVCLANQRRRAQALVQAFENADAALVNHGPAALDALPPLSACSNATALLARSPLPDDTEKRARIAALEGKSARLAVLTLVPGKLQSTLEGLNSALAEARQTGYLSLVARILVQRARIETATDLKRAHETLHEAAVLALEGRDDGALADAWSYGIYTSPNATEGHRLSRYAQAAIRRLGGDDEREGTRLAYLVGLLVWKEHRFEEALPLALRSRELLVKSRGPDYLGVGNAEEMLGAVEFYLGRGEEALATYKRSEQIRIKNYGPAVGAAGIALGNQGSVLYWLGRFDEAALAQRRGIAIVESAAPGYWNSFYGHNQLAMALRGQGKFADALEEDLLSEKMLASFKPLEAGAHDHCDPLMGEGADLLGLARAREAVSPLEHALRLCEKDVDSYNPASMQLLLARALWESGGDKDRARKLGRAAADAFKLAADRYGSWFIKLHHDAALWVAAHR